MKEMLACAIASVFVLAGSVQAAVIQLNFLDQSVAPASVQIGSSGYWTRIDGGSNAVGNVTNLKDNANADTGISLTWVETSEQQSTVRGEGGTGAAGTAADGLSTWTAAAASADTNSGVTYTAPGKYFPWAVVDSYNADSDANGMSFTLASATQLTYTFWIVSSYDRNNPTDTTGHFNIGGTYNGATDTFSGGTTLTLNGAKVQQSTDTLLDDGETSPGSVKYAVGTFGQSFQSAYNAISGKYELKFQAGDSATGNFVALNGMIIEAVPEPGTLVALGGGLVLLALGRRRVR